MGDRGIRGYMDGNGTISGSEKRLTELGTGNWNNRGIDNHIKRPAGVSSAGLKRLGMKRIDGIPHPQCGNTSEGMEASLKYPKQCLVNNEHVYDGLSVFTPVSAAEMNSFDMNQRPAGAEASKTVALNNYAALITDKDDPSHGKVPSWLYGSVAKKKFARHYSDFNPVRHDHVLPHYVPPRPIRRMGPDGNASPPYDNGAARLNWNLQNQQLNTGPLALLSVQSMSKKDWKEVAQRVHISPLGEVVINLGGMEDLRPACIKEYQKADKPGSILTQYENESRQFARFERDWPRPANRNHVSNQSGEMLRAMSHDDVGMRTPSRASEFQQSVVDTPSRRLASEYSYSGTRDPAPDLRPSTAPVQTPMSAREPRRSPGMSNFDSGRSGGSRTPMSARGSAFGSRTAASTRDRYFRDDATDLSFREDPSYANDRGSYRGDRSYADDRSYYSYEDNAYRDDRSIASSYWYGEDGGGSRTGKSLDRVSRSQRTPGRSSVSGMFSDPSRTTTEKVLNEALKSARGPRRP